MAQVGYVGLTFKSAAIDPATDASHNRTSVLVVVGVDKDSPAAKAGIKVNDSIFSISLTADAGPYFPVGVYFPDGKVNLNAVFQASTPGSLIVLTTFQNKTSPIIITVGASAPTVPKNPTPGAGYSGYTFGSYQQNGYDCLWVTGIANGSPAAKDFPNGVPKAPKVLLCTQFVSSNNQTYDVHHDTPLLAMISSCWPGDTVHFTFMLVDNFTVIEDITETMKLANSPAFDSSGNPNNTSPVLTYPSAPPGSSINEQNVAALDASFAFISNNGFFKPAFGPDFKTTAEYMADYLSTVDRSGDTPPAPPNANEMSIGACKFVVPPVNIQVSRSFQTGSLAGGAIRQIVPPKFNSGHSETVIGIKLYFPNQETIWGYDGDSLTIDFTKDSEAVIDRYLSSLRGLITAFRYSPILPINNTYLNSTFDVTAVALKTMTVSTESDSGTDMPFPFCIVVSLELLAFDHSVFLPMVNQLGDAVDWGKYRVYMGRCAYIMEAAANKQFATVDMQGAYQGTGPQSANPNELAGINVLNSANYDPTQSGNATASFSIFKDLADSTNVQFYYPPQDPVGQVPDFLTVDNFLPSTEDTATNQSWWDVFTGSLGLSQGSYGTWSQVAKYFNDPNLASQYKIVKQWLLYNKATYNQYGPEQQAAYVAYATRGLTGAALANATISAQQAFLANAANEYLTGNPTLQNLFNAQAFLRGQSLIDEWDVPMAQLPIDSTNIIVTSVSVQTVNNFARLPLSMRDQPVYQHIGGLGSIIEINLYAKGEADLTKLRLMFDTISNLAKLEHSHAVLGFLGLKNVIIALAGTKYVIPSSFDVETMNGLPHTYSVRMTFADFDIFQQKRESLSSEQQSRLIEQFGKANPFLRLKQSWGMFNAYPDLPLSVIANETTTTGDVTVNSGDIVGHLDPDFYFYSYQTIDDDLATLPDSSSNAQKYGTTGSANYAVVHHLGNLSDSGDHFSIGLNDGYWDIRTNDTVHAGGITYNEPHPGNVHQNPFVPGLAPSSITQTPNFHTSADGSQSTTGLVEANFKLMMQDQQYRDQNGRMIRAFPTYMLWLINEGGLFAGQQLFDNFYGLQSVIDFSFVDNEDVMGTTLILRVSNLYSRLSTTYSQQVDPKFLPQAATLINPTLNLERNLQSGETNTTVLLDTISIQPGVRLHMRAGYGSNPNLLQTIFNGTVTGVEVGDIMTITAQSDAIELGAVVNNTNTSGSSTDIFGSVESGLWFSQPRDLMVRLLSMGASTMKEAIAQATAGAIFSENRFGIRHFGRVLYDGMTPNESNFQQARETAITGSYNNSSGSQFAQQIANQIGSASADPASAFNPLSAVGNLVDMMNSMYANFSAAKDLEIFKRNIYPGNGTGVGQYTGGDLGDGGTATAFAPTGISDTGTITSVDASGNPVNNSGYVIPGQPTESAADILKAANQQQFTPPADSSANANKNGGFVSSLVNDVGSVLTFGASNSGFMQQLFSVTGISNPNGNLDEGAGPGTGGGLLGQYSGPFAEVSFRAHTYMKTVWDLFLVCAALLPNYVVAVRPFEERSTIFYGKPHWSYTSGVLPVSTGRTKGSIDPNQYPNAGTPAPTSPFYNGSKGAQSLQNQIQKAVEDMTSGGSGGGGTGQSTYQKLTTISVQEWQNVIGPAQATLSNDPSTTASASTQQPPAVLPSPSTGILPINGKVNPQQVYAEVLGQGGSVTQAQVAAALVDGIESDGDPLELAGGKGPAQGLFQFEPSTWTGGAGGGKNGLPSTVAAATWQQQVTGFINDTGGPGGTNFQAWGPDIVTNPGNPNDPNNPAYRYTGPPQPGSKVANKIAELSTSFVGITATTDPTGLTNPFGTVALTPSPEGTPSWVTGNLDRTETNYETQSAIRGATEYIEVDFTGVYTVNGQKITDTLGDAAKSLYANFRTDDQANAIWEAFRTQFGSGPITSTSDSSNGDPTVDQSGTDPKTYFKNAFSQHLGKNWESAYKEVLIGFREFMWTNAYHRGWIVLTADAAASTNVVGNAIADIFGTIESLFSNTQLHGVQDAWVFPRAFDLFKIYIGGPSDAATNNAGTGEQAAIDWMQRNNGAGESQTNPFARMVEDVGQDFADPTGRAAAATYSVISNVAGSVVDTLRMSLSLVSGGMNLAFYAGGQANLLSSVFDDSIYYDALLPGGIGGLDWLCDNVFTREYGEPVVEIREPFQRVHYINSFQHIIANGIVESSDQVATVVTCTTDGQHPVTASFDKGAPAERQVEITVDDGLMWQAPNGISSIFHPLKLIAAFISHFNNGDDATNANRVARWNLKENLKNIYTGELIILGNAQIRTYDLIYLYDSYEKMYGLFEVEQVVHQFNSEMGFITSITPNAIVMINDPAKWQMGSMLHRQAAAQAIRNSVRTTLSSGQQGQNLVKSPDQTTLTNFANGMASDLLGTTQYTGGVGALVKDMGGVAGMDGSLIGHPKVYGNSSSGGSGIGTAIDATAGSLTGGIASGVAATTGTDFTGLAKTVLEWPVYSWLRDNLCDAHAFYIQNLNRNVTPMDAGLSYNFGTAVGQANVISLFGDALQIPVSEGGQSTVTTSQLLTSLGWTSKQTIDQANAISQFENYTFEKVLTLSGKAPASTATNGNPPTTAIVSIASIIDGTTFTINETVLGLNKIILAFILPPNSNGLSVLNDPSLNLDVKAMGYIQSISSQLISLYGEDTVAVRVDTANAHPANDNSGILATVFFRLPSDGATINDSTITAKDRTDELKKIADNYQGIAWNDYMANGYPYTLNQEMINEGLATINTAAFGGINDPLKF